MRECSHDTCSARIPPHVLHVMGHMPTRHTHEYLHVITIDHQDHDVPRVLHAIHGVIPRKTWILVTGSSVATTHEYVLEHNHVMTPTKTLHYPTQMQGM